MAYTKHTWTSDKIPANLKTPARFRNLESQHENAIVDARVANNPLIAETGAGTAEAGALRVDSGKLYGYDGTDWIMLGVS